MARELHPEHDTLARLIAARIAAHERSAQVSVGPSELGTPCARKLGFKLAHVEPVNGLDDVPWRPTVGTAVHEWLAAMLRAENARLQAEVDAATARKKTAPCGHPWCGPFGHEDRFLVEYRTVVGTLADHPVPGTIDVFDRATGRVIDWKIVGPTTLREQRKRCRKGGPGPGTGYREQGQLYARGLHRSDGFEVAEVCVYFLPSNGELDDAVFWSEPYDPAVGAAVLRRARAILAALAEHGPQRVLPKLQRVNDHCAHCPFFAPGTTDLTVGCPGADDLIANTGDRFNDLLPS